MKQTFQIGVEIKGDSMIKLFTNYKTIIKIICMIQQAKPTTYLLFPIWNVNTINNSKLIKYSIFPLAEQNLSKKHMYKQIETTGGTLRIRLKHQL